MIRYDVPFNYPELNHVGRTAGTGTVLCLLNDDAEPMDPDWLDEMVAQALRSEIGVVGALLLHEDGTIQHAGVIVGAGGGGGAHYLRTESLPRLVAEGFCCSVRQYGAVTAACMVMRTQVYDDMGGMDLHHLPVNYNDVDFCLRVQDAKLRVLFTPHVRLWHLESASRKRNRRKKNERQWRRDVEVLTARWEDRLRADPFFSPNLSDESTSPVLAFPPRCRAPWSTPEATADMLARSVEDSTRFAGIHRGLAFYRAAQVAVDAQDLDLARRAILAAAKQIPDDPRILLAAALIHRRRGDIGTAEAALRRLIEIYPTIVSGLFNLGNLYLDRGQPERAEVLYRKVLEQLPAHLGAIVNLAAALQAQGRSDAVVDTLDQGLRQFPNNPRILMQLGVAFMQRSEPQSAVHCFRAAQQSDPDDRMAAFNLGTALKALGKLDAARETYETAIGRFGVNEEILLNFAGILVDLGQSERAKTNLLRFSQTTPVSIQFSAALADLYLRTGDLLRGLTLTAALRARSPNDHGLPIWDGTSSLQGRSLVVDCESDRRVVLLLLPALATLCARAKAVGAKITIAVPADLARLVERISGDIPIRPAADVSGFDCRVLIEQAPQILEQATGDAAPFEIGPLRGKLPPAPEPIAGRIQLEFSGDGPVDPTVWRAALGAIDGRSVSLQGSSEVLAQNLLDVASADPGVVRVLLLRRWDALDRLDQLGSARLVVTDDAELALLARLQERDVLLVDADDHWIWTETAIGAYGGGVKVIRADIDDPGLA